MPSPLLPRYELDQRRVVELHTGVDVRDGDARALDAVLRPHLVGLDVGDAPLDRVHGLFGGALGDLGVLYATGGVQALDLGAGGQVLRECRASRR